MVYRGPGGVNVVINPYFCGKLMEMVLRAALLQMDIEWGKPAANRAVAGRLVRALHDTDIAFLPEMFTTGFMAADTALAEPMEGPSVEWMRCTAAENGYRPGRKPYHRRRQRTALQPVRVRLSGRAYRLVRQTAPFFVQRRRYAVCSRMRQGRIGIQGFPYPADGVLRPSFPRVEPRSVGL